MTCGLAGGQVKSGSPPGQLFAAGNPEVDLRANIHLGALWRSFKGCDLGMRKLAAMLCGGGGGLWRGSSQS